MNILLTGSNGFIGQNLLSKKRNEKLNFISTNNLFDNNSPSIDGSTDWSNKLKNIQVIIHLAGIAHTYYVKEDTYRFTNLEGTLNLARCAAEQGVKKFIFLSSTNIYQQDDVITTNTQINPTNLQAIIKYETEIELAKISKKHGIDIIIIRSPLVYGPGVKANFAMMLKLAATGLPLPFGCIKNNQRSMVYVENLISLIIECINNTNATNQTFLISDDDDLSTKVFVQGLSKALGKSRVLLPVPNAVFSLVGKALGKSAIIDRLCGSLQVDINHTKNTLNWQPPYSVEQGFLATANAFKKNKH
jgi:nucleoside-diphosphate-sugar epimerase